MIKVVVPETVHRKNVLPFVRWYSFVVTNISITIVAHLSWAYVFVVVFKLPLTVQYLTISIDKRFIWYSAVVLLTSNL